MSKRSHKKPSHPQNAEAILAKARKIASNARVELARAEYDLARLEALEPEQINTVLEIFLEFS